MDGTVWMANVQDINDFEAEVKFMHPRFQAATYYRPQEDDFCIAPICNVICIIDTLNILGRSERLYKLLDKTKKKNTHVSRNVGNQKNVHLGSHKCIFLINFIEFFK